MFHTADVSPASAAQERPEQDILRAASPSEELISIELASASSDNSPGVRDGLPWTAEEDDLLFATVVTTGLHWKLVAERLPGRSASSTRNRWSRVGRGIEKTVLRPSSNYFCRRCGLPQGRHVCPACFPLDGVQDKARGEPRRGRRMVSHAAANLRSLVAHRPPSPSAPLQKAPRQAPPFLLSPSGGDCGALISQAMPVLGSLPPPLPPRPPRAGLPPGAAQAPSPPTGAAPAPPAQPAIYAVPLFYASAPKLKDGAPTLEPTRGDVGVKSELCSLPWPTAYAIPLSHASASPSSRAASTFRSNGESSAGSDGVHAAPPQPPTGVAPTMLAQHAVYAVPSSHASASPSKLHGAPTLERTRSDVRSALHLQPRADAYAAPSHASEAPSFRAASTFSGADCGHAAPPSGLSVLAGLAAAL